MSRSMHSHALPMFVLLLAGALAGCYVERAPRQPPPQQQGAQPQPAPAPQPAPTTAQPAPTATTPGASSGACPPPNTPQQGTMCPQVIAYAKNTSTGACCTYPTPCHVPQAVIAAGWQPAQSCP